MKYRLLLQVNGGRWATLEIKHSKEEAYEQYDLYKAALGKGRELKVVEDDGSDS